MTNKEIEKMRDAHDAAIIYLMKDENIKSTVKGTLPELLVLVGKIMTDIDKEAQVND